MGARSESRGSGDGEAAARELLRGACVGLALRKSARRVSRLYDEALAPHGLTIGQLGVLAAVSALGGSSVQELADAFDMDQSAMSRMLRPLERDGLVLSATDETDRRRRIVALSAEGRERMTLAAVAWREVQRGLERAHGAETLGRLREALGALASDDGRGGAAAPCDPAGGA